MGEKTAVIYPDGKRAEYEYNQAMQLVALHTGSDTIQYAYDEIGRISKKMLPNGVDTTYHYSAFGRVDEIRHQGANVSESYKYEFDVYGNKISTEKNRAGVEADNGKFTYVYDELSRLSEVHHNDELLRKYTYDAFGNRTQRYDYSTGTENVTNYVYNINNQLLSETDAFTSKSYTYDRRGNLLNMKSKEEVLKAFTFDATNRMTASMGIVDGIQKNATYAYNGLGHRMEQNVYTGILPENPEKKIQYTIDMTRQYYNLLQTNSGEENAQTYYWDGNVVGMESYGEESFYLQDDLGSPMQLLGADGMSHETFAYDEFGLGLVDQPRNSQAFGFTGYQMDEVGGLYFAQARRYDSRVGRFISEDKVRGFVVVPFTMNHYGYCWNDPEDYVDRDGNIPTVLIGAGIGAVAGGLLSIGSDLLAGEEIDWGKAGKTAIAGAAAGALIGTGAGAVVAAAKTGAGATMVIGAGVGAATSASVETGVQIYDSMYKEGKDFTEAMSTLDGGKIALEGINGAVKGLFAGTGMAGVGLATVYSGTDMAANVIDQHAIKKQDYDITETLVTGAWSFGATLAGEFAGELKSTMRNSNKPKVGSVDYIRDRCGAYQTNKLHVKNATTTSSLNKYTTRKNRNLTELWGASVAFGANELYQTTSGAIKDELYVNEVKEEMKEIISEQIISSECGE